ncbi:PEP-CTERM sorting domain-containing protein [Cerasicoccus frondis]|uniref:PEP-CTERM sorting domain-containing protein n=1 Tax=Cerasicoccus frondis TaxID=490090 RepID=UPI0028527E6A|nr:PEP-CTERM sorting domain-containing protein [Cerasicoccus frondis]
MLNAQVIYSYDFNGPDTSVSGVTVNPEGGSWVTGGGTIDQNGSTAGTGGAVLPYSFGTGIYEHTADINTSMLGTTSTSLAAIYFTNSDPLAAGYVTNSVSPFATFALRGNGDFDMWAGEGTSGNVDGGNLSDYGYSVSTSTDRIGQLRLVLDTTATNWTLSAYYTPSSIGASEFQIDLNGASAGGDYTYSTNPAAFTGSGVMTSISTGDQVFANYTLTSIPEPSFYAMLVGVGVMAVVYLRRRN